MANFAAFILSLTGYWKMASDSKKYDVVRVQTARSDDSRPESRRVNLDAGITVVGHIGTEDRWAERDIRVEPFRARSMAAIEIVETASSQSLALLRPREIIRLEIQDETPNWTDSQQAKLLRDDMFLPRNYKPLQKIPHKFFYHWKCFDEKCSGHRMLCIDWELHQSYRSWVTKYGPNDWEDKLRLRYERDLPARDLEFFVGTIRAHPHNWLIVGLYYPPKRDSPSSEVSNLQLPFAD